MQHLILLRGLPGAGKTEFAKLIMGTGNVHYLRYEADTWFDKHNEGKFDASKLSDAHLWCLSKTESALSSGISVIVSNTFTQEWEMQKYIDLAKKYNVRLTSLIVENRHGNSSIHNVPEATMQKMKNRFEVKL